MKRSEPPALIGTEKDRQAFERQADQMVHAIKTLTDVTIYQKQQQEKIAEKTNQDEKTREAFLEENLRPSREVGKLREESERRDPSRKERHQPGRGDNNYRQTPSSITS